MKKGRKAEPQAASEQAAAQPRRKKPRLAAADDTAAAAAAGSSEHQVDVVCGDAKGTYDSSKDSVLVQSGAEKGSWVTRAAFVGLGGRKSHDFWKAIKVAGPDGQPGGRLGRYLEERGQHPSQQKVKRAPAGADATAAAPAEGLKRSARKAARDSHAAAAAAAEPAAAEAAASEDAQHEPEPAAAAAAGSAGRGKGKRPAAAKPAAAEPAAKSPVKSRAKSPAQPAAKSPAKAAARSPAKTAVKTKASIKAKAKAAAAAEAAADAAAEHTTEETPAAAVEAPAAAGTGADGTADAGAGAEPQADADAEPAAAASEPTAEATAAQEAANAAAAEPAPAAAEAEADAVMADVDAPDAEADTLAPADAPVQDTLHQPTAHKAASEQQPPQLSAVPARMLEAAAVGSPQLDPPGSMLAAGPAAALAPQAPDAHTGGLADVQMSDAGLTFHPDQGMQEPHLLPANQGLEHEGLGHGEQQHLGAAADGLVKPAEGAAAQQQAQDQAVLGDQL